MSVEFAAHQGRPIGSDVSEVRAEKYYEVRYIPM